MRIGYTRIFFFFFCTATQFELVYKPQPLCYSCLVWTLTSSPPCGCAAAAPGCVEPDGDTELWRTWTAGYKPAAGNSPGGLTPSASADPANTSRTENSERVNLVGIRTLTGGGCRVWPAAAAGNQESSGPAAGAECEETVWSRRPGCHSDRAEPVRTGGEHQSTNQDSSN